MATNASEVVVGSGGRIYIAPVGTAAPTTSVSALDSDYRDLGFISEDGISATFGVSVEDINSFQSLLPIRRVVTGRSTDLSFTLRQWNVDTFSFALGGGSVEANGSEYTFYPPANGDALQESAVVVEWADGDKHYRLFIAKAVVTDAVETSITRNAAADLPISLSVLGSENDDAWYLLTDDDAFNPGA